MSSADNSTIHLTLQFHKQDQKSKVLATCSSAEFTQINPLPDSQIKFSTGLGIWRALLPKTGLLCVQAYQPDPRIEVWDKIWIRFLELIHLQRFAESLRTVGSAFFIDGQVQLGVPWMNLKNPDFEWFWSRGKLATTWAWIRWVARLNAAALAIFDKIWSLPQRKKQES